jgi:glycosyltransferase involved in cell wall biosynthesis
MDSSLADQLTDKWWLLRPLRPLFWALERLAVAGVTVVLPVCEDLAVKVRPWIGDRNVIVIPDVPAGDLDPAGVKESLRTLAGPGDIIGLYVGNLERYQGIDLLLESIAQLQASVAFKMLVIGGSANDIRYYRKRAEALSISGRVEFLGPRPVAQLNSYLTQADVLVSPRTLGTNTPMKVYSYMQSGKAILATDIRSHTQALDAETAELVPAQPEAIAAGLLRLSKDAALRARLGDAAQAKAKREYSIEAYRARLKQAYGLVAE